MPLTRKGKEIEHAMDKEYGAKKGKQVFYASINAGKIKGAEPHGYGHKPSQKQGHYRMSGNPKAHRIGG